MKQLLACFLFLLVGKVYSAKIPGHYINKNNDTIKVVFKIDLIFKVPCFGGNYLRYYDRAESNHTVKLKPNQTREAFFSYNGEDFRLIAHETPAELWLSYDDGIFMRIIRDGKLKLFNECFCSTTSVGYIPVVKNSNDLYNNPVWLLKDNDTLVRLRPMYFFNDLAWYLSDCPSIKQKVLDRFYKREEIELVVEEYNQTCGGQ